MPNPSTATGSKLAAVKTKPAKSAATYPPRPATIPEEMQPVWEQLIAHLRSLDMWVPEKSTIVENYLLNLHVMRQAYHAMQADGGPIGPDGRAHQASGVIARHSAAAQKCAIFLGLGKDYYGQVEQSVKTASTSSVWG